MKLAENAAGRSRGAEAGRDGGKVTALHHRDTEDTEKSLSVLSVSLWLKAFYPSGITCWLAGATCSVYTPSVLRTVAIGLEAGELQDLADDLAACSCRERRSHPTPIGASLRSVKRDGARSLRTGFPAASVR